MSEGNSPAMNSCEEVMCTLDEDYGLLRWSLPRKLSKFEEEINNEQSSGSESENMEFTCKIENLLDCIIKRKESIQNGEVCVKSVSNQPATREDVVKLADKLDMVLMENGARETGICDTRNSIYAELFDELIRQESVVCVERGQMLVAMRDELKRTLEEYKTLYLSSTGYGIRKDIEAEEVKLKLEKELDDLQLKLKTLQNETDYLAEKYEFTEKQFEETKRLSEEKHNSITEYYKENNKILKEKLVSVLAPKK